VHQPDAPNVCASVAPSAVDDVLERQAIEVPLPLVWVIDRPRAAIRSVELFTDGYFKPGASAAVADWEAAFADVERVDPEKIDPYPSVKGSAGRLRTDDRTVVIVHL